MAISRAISQLFSRPSERAGRTRRGERSPDRARRPSMTVETLERRAMLAIDATFTGGVLTIDYNQPDADGLVATTNQNAVIEIDEINTTPVQTVRVNLYRSSNPNADVYVGVTEIIVNVPDYDLLGV